MIGKMSIKTYNLHSSMQLVELNGDLSNFMLDWSAVSKNGVPFELLVVDQELLDSGQHLEFRKVNDYQEGRITENENNEKTYYLALKSAGKCKCEVTVNSEEIPSKVQENFMSNNPHNIYPPKSTRTINWKLIFILIVVAGGVYLLYHFFIKTKNKDNSLTYKRRYIQHPRLPLDNSLTNPSSVTTQNPVINLTSPVVKTSTITNSMLNRINDL
jgi:hypothetical protein